MPALRHRQQTLSAELQAIADCTKDRAAFLRLAETLTAFLARLRSAAETLSVIERQKIVRLLVKDVLVGEDSITIRHSIPIPSGSPQNGGSDPNGQNYLLCKRRGDRALDGGCGLDSIQPGEAVTCKNLQAQAVPPKHLREAGQLR
jgi:site-specific DNA recombinase